MNPSTQPRNSIRCIHNNACRRIPGTSSDEFHFWKWPVVRLQVQFGVVMLDNHGHSYKINISTSSVPPSCFKGTPGTWKMLFRRQWRVAWVEIAGYHPPVLPSHTAVWLNTPSDHTGPHRTVAGIIISGRSARSTTQRRRWLRQVDRLGKCVSHHWVLCFSTGLMLSHDRKVAGTGVCWVHVSRQGTVGRWETSAWDLHTPSSDSNLGLENNVG